jgi:hypothetical protein
MPYKFKENVAYTEGTKHLWDVYEDENGNSSLTLHKPKLIWESCPLGQCYLELTDPVKRECTCRYCKRKETFVLGLQSLVDGKIVNLR